MVAYLGYILNSWRLSMFRSHDSFSPLLEDTMSRYDLIVFSS